MVNITLKQYDSTIGNLNWEVLKKFKYGTLQKLNAWNI